MDFEFTQEEFNHPWRTRWCFHSYSLWYFHPETWGRWTHFDKSRICFQLRAFNSKQVMAWRGAQLFDAGLSGSSQKNVVGNTPPMPTPGGNEAILRDYISHQGGMTSYTKRLLARRFLALAGMSVYLWCRKTRMQLWNVLQPFKVGNPSLPSVAGVKKNPATPFIFGHP